jgi:hypothetical protein
MQDTHSFRMMVDASEKKLKEENIDKIEGIVNDNFCTLNGKMEKR